MRSRCAALPFLLAGALVSSSFAQIRFVESSAAAGLHLEAGESNGAAFGDADGDGWPDLLVARTSRDEAALLYRNQRDGTFVAGVFSWTPPVGAVGGVEGAAEQADARLGGRRARPPQGRH